MSFEGFPAATFSWFSGLEADNSKAWFTAHRDTYDEAVRDALEEMLEQLAEELGGRVKMFRQHRDVRFSADKSPYKTTTYGLILDRLEPGPDGIAHDAALDLCRSTWAACAPISAWLDEHVGASAIPVETRYGRRR